MLQKIITDKGYDLEINLAGELQHQIFFVLKSIFWGNAKKKRTNYKLVLNSKLMKDYLCCDDKYLSKSHKYLKKVAYTKSYFLMKLYFYLLAKKFKKSKQEKIFY